MAFISWVSNSKHICATVAGEAELAQGIYLLHADRCTWFPSVHYAKYSWIWLHSYQNQPTHCILSRSPLNIKHPPSEGGDEGISSRAEEPGNYGRHLSPAWCSSSRSFPASSTRDQRIRPHDTPSLWHRIREENNYQRNTSCNWVTVTPGIEHKDLRAKGFSTHFTATCCFSLMVPHLLQHHLKINVSLTSAVTELFTLIYPLITAV